MTQLDRTRLRGRRTGFAPPAALLALSSMMIGTTARADTHRICLDFELGPQLWDASPRPNSNTPCTTDADCTPPGVEAWEICSGLGTCVWGSSANRDHGEERGRWEGDRPFPAMRRLIRVLDVATDEVVWGWGPLDDLGCTGMFDDVALGSSITDVRIEHMRWAITPEGTQLIGYECELSGSMSGPDGECETLDIQSAITTPVGGPSSDCGGTGDPIDHCTDYEISDGFLLEAVDYNLWSTTFADAEVNSGGTAFEPTQIYLLQETDLANSADSSAGPWMGGHHALRFRALKFHSKFRAAHEYGHLAAFMIPSAQDSPPHPFGFNDIDYDAQGLGSHTMSSPEWDATAAIEGFAHFVALAAWHNMSDSVVLYPQFPEEVDGGQLAERRDFATISSPINCVPACTTGQSNEWAWGVALRSFLLSSPAPALNLITGMLAAVHGSMWHPSGDNDDFANEFDDVMSPAGQDYLGDQDLYENWADIVAEWEIGA